MYEAYAPLPFPAKIQADKIDGGFMPEPHDTVPLDHAAVRLPGGTRFKHGPVKPRDIPPDTVPTGGAVVAKKLLYSKSDKPWTGTAKGKDYLRIAEDTVPFGHTQTYGNSLPGLGEADDSMTGRRNKSGYKRGGPGGSAHKYKASGPDHSAFDDDGWNDSLDNFTDDFGRGRPMPFRAGKVHYPHSAYPHAPDPPVKQEPPVTGLNLKTGNPGREYLQSDIFSGPSMVSAQKPSGVDLARGLVNAPTQTGKMKTSMRKRDTFGSYPKHMADPYLDNPLGDGHGGAAKGKKGVYTHTSRPKPNMPIVNVWDGPAGLQTKAGVKVGNHRITGERNTYLADSGRLGCTM